MYILFRQVHVLAVSLWFGSVVFFTISGVLIFQSFRELSNLAPAERPLWFPVPEFYAGEAPTGLPSPLRLEQGSRAAGVAVGGIFPFYYALQFGCGMLAVLSAWYLGRSQLGIWSRRRFLVCLLALLTVVLGWWLEQRVSELRVSRNELTDLVLISPEPSTKVLAEMQAAREAFGYWHNWSLIQNFLTLILVFAITWMIPMLSNDSFCRH